MILLLLLLLLLLLHLNDNYTLQKVKKCSVHNRKFERVIQFVCSSDSKKNKKIHNKSVRFSSFFCECVCDV